MDKKSMASGAAAVVLAAGLALTPAVTETDITKADYNTEIGYSFTYEGERSKTLTIDVPDSLSADIVTMYVNGAEVTTVLLPDNPHFTTIPVVFEDLDNIEFKLYRMGEEIGTARFIGDILKTNAKAVE